MLTVTERATTKLLTTLARVKAELGSPDSADALLTDFIADASEDIADFLERVFAREAVTEKLDGDNRTRIMLTRTPVARLIEVRYDGGIEPSDSYSIEDADAGFVYRNGGWISSEAHERWIELARVNAPGQRLWAFDYVGGYLLPGHDISGKQDISVAAADKSLNSASAGFPLLVPGDVIVTSGFSNATNNKSLTVVTRTASKLTVSEALVDENAGASVSIKMRNLPRNIERLCIETVKWLYQTRKTNRDVKSEELGDYSVEYRDDKESSSRFPAHVERALCNMKRVA